MCFANSMAENQPKPPKTKNQNFSHLHLLPPTRIMADTNTNTGEPQSSLPTVLRDVTPLGTRMNGTYCAVWVFLTFAGLYAGEWTMLEAVVRTLDAKYKRKNRHIEAYVACREIHANPADPLRNHHLHVLIKSNARLEHNNQNFWDLRGSAVDGYARRLHPYIITPINAHRDHAKLVMYLMKDGNVLMKLGRPFSAYQEEADKTWGERINACVGRVEAEAMMCTEYPDIWYKHGPTIMTMMDDHFANSQAPQYQECEFVADTDVLMRAKNANKSLILTGVAGTGKTQYSLGMPPNTNNLIVRTRSDLKKMTRHTDCIVFDDWNMSNWTFEEAIHLADLELPSTIKCRYRDVTIPAGMARVFTTNLPALDIFPTPGNEQQKDGLARRIQVVNVTAKLFVDMDGVDSP